MVDFLNNTVPEFALGFNEWDEFTFTAGGAVTYPQGTVLAQLAATGKLVPYDAGGSLGSEIPKAVLNNELVAAGAGDTAIRALISGKVRQDALTAWNSGTPIALTALERTELRDFTIITQADNELLAHDNST